MKIENVTYHLTLEDGATWLERIRRPFALALGDHAHPLSLRRPIHAARNIDLDDIRADPDRISALKVR